MCCFKSIWQHLNSWRKCSFVRFNFAKPGQEYQSKPKSENSITSHENNRCCSERQKEHLPTCERHQKVFNLNMLNLNSVLFWNKIHNIFNTLVIAYQFLFFPSVSDVFYYFVCVVLPWIFILLITVSMLHDLGIFGSCYYLQSQDI